MTHWKQINSDYLGAYAMEPNKDLILTIKHCHKEEVASSSGKDEKVVAHFINQGIKPMILNSTNCSTIEKIYGTPEIEQWAGKQVQVFVAKVKAFGDVHDALRIRPFAPKTTKPVLDPTSQKWAGAVKALRDGTTTIPKIQAAYELSEEHRLQLIDDAEDVTPEGGENA